MENNHQGMSESEVQKHVDRIGTINAKIIYLNDILQKSGLLNENTIVNVNRILAGLYERKGDFRSAGMTWKNAGDMRKAAEAFEEYGSSTSASYAWIEAGNLERAAELLEEEAEMTNACYSSGLEKAGDLRAKMGESEKAIKNYERTLKLAEATRTIHKCILDRLVDKLNNIRSK